MSGGIQSLFYLLFTFLQHTFGLYYGAQAVGAAYESLYKNYKGIQDGWAIHYVTISEISSFIEFWKIVADYFKDDPNVLGYELINEPVWMSCNLQ